MKARALIGSALFACVVVTASLPAFAANPSLTLSPNHGTASTTFSARVTYTVKGRCPTPASFSWDSVSLGSAGFVGGGGTCTATRSGLKPPSGHNAPGTHTVRATFVDKQQSTHSTVAVFIVTKPAPKPTPTPTPTKTATPKPSPSPSKSPSASPSASPSVSASVTPTPSSTPTVSASPSATATAIAAPSTTPTSSLNVPSEAVVHHGSGAFWLILAIMGILVLGPGLWFVLGGNRPDTPPPSGSDH